MLNYMLLTIVVNGNSCNMPLHVASVAVGNAVCVCVCVCVNAAIEINVLDYSVTVHSVNGV